MTSFPTAKILKSSSIRIKEEDDPPDSLSFNKESVLVQESSKRNGSFFVAQNNFLKTLKISYEIGKDNFKIKISDNFEYSVYYPERIWENLERKTKEVLLDNFIYAKTAPLVIFWDNFLSYQSSKPLLKDFIDEGVLKDLPRISELSQIKTKNLLENFQKNNTIIFQNKNATEKLLSIKKTSEKRAILALSFGKDSLLSYGLAKEIGLDCYPVFINDIEKYNPQELKHKEKIIKLFSQKEKQTISYLKDETDGIFRTKEVTKERFGKFTEKFDMTNAMLVFTLELIPLINFYQAKYIIFGNERDYNHYYLNEEKFRVYHSYDQTPAYTRKENYYLNNLTKNIQVISLVESLYNIAEMKILSHRYPKLLNYLMSCSDEKIKDEKWCCQCSVCAEMFLYSAAVNLKPENIGIKKNLFKKEYKKLYPLFAPDQSPSKIYQIYKVPPLTLEEHLLAFLLAFQNGFKGELIDLFKSKYLKQAQRKEKELRKKFFGLHSTRTISEELKSKVLSIFHEELKDLQ